VWLEVDTALSWAKGGDTMLESLKRSRGKRWPRGQKFALSPEGVASELAYREAVQKARALGRATLVTAQQAWAAPHGLEPGDGVVLGELRSGRKSIAEIARRLEDCGTSLTEVKIAVDRLSDAHLIEPSPIAAEVA